MKCSSPYGNVTPGLERNRDGENSSLVTHGTFPLPHSWLSSCDKIKIPHSRLRRSWGIFISPRLLSHSWGIGKYLSWLVGNFIIPCTRGFAARAGIIPSLQIRMMGLAQSFSQKQFSWLKMLWIIGFFINIVEEKSFLGENEKWVLFGILTINS